MSDAATVISVLTIISFVVAVLFWYWGRPYKAAFAVLIGILLVVAKFHVAAQAADPSYEGPIEAIQAYFTE